MRLDLDPRKNGSQFEKLRSFSNAGNVILRKEFFVFVGFCFLVFGLFSVFSSQTQWNSSGLTQKQYGAISILLGFASFGACYLATRLSRKIGEYQPRKNSGKEWEQ
jgi:hypothetical protein